MFADFKSITEVIEKFKSLIYMVLRDAVSTLETFVWILNHVSRSINGSLFFPKSIKLGQMTTLNVIFHVVLSAYQLVEI